MLELYVVNNPYVFLGVNGDRRRNPLSLVGIPFDSTNSFRGGSRFAPMHIRLASHSLETYSFRSGLSLEENPPVDEGDIAVVHGSAEATLRNVSVVAEELFKSRKAGFIGGDHIITYGIVEGLIKTLRKTPCVLVLDAHLDFRPDYLGFKYSHACVTRRLSELIGARNMMVLGFRAVDVGELREAKEAGLKMINSYELHKMTLRETLNKVRDFLSTCSHTYISLDTDVIDPAYAPGVATPEPEGLQPTLVIDLITDVIDEKIAGFDLVEVNPLVDVGNTTSFLAAKILIEISARFLNILRTQK
ncbi:MAG: agmatinase [Desulfurococcaceae archaeon TW002]